MIMSMLFKILIFLAVTVLPQEALLLYQNNRPTPKGIDKYVNENSNDFIDEFQQYIKDSIYADVYITTTDLQQLADYDSLELGRTEIYSNSGYEVIIGNTGKFNDYSLYTLKHKKRLFKNFDQYSQFVKSTVVHELSHVYFRQIMMILARKDSLNTYYRNVQLYPNPERRYGSEFIEEGLCEYLTRNKGELLEIKDVYKPETTEDLLNRYNVAKVKYQYSSYYLKNFMDSVIAVRGKAKYGIEVLLSHNPPNYSEILQPKLYFNRLK